MSLLAPPRRLIAREVSLGFDRCLRTDTTVHIDVWRAQAQHAAYLTAVRELGIPVDVLPPDDACPDCCFIEDTAVVIGQHAVLTRPGALARRDEVTPVGTSLAAHVEVHRMEAPATLDGGDVLRVGEQLFVGLSTRTNPEGVAFLRSVAILDGVEVVAVVVRDGLHLKSACSLADGSTLVFDPAALDAEALAVLRDSGLHCLPTLEPAGANVLALGTTVLVSAAAPATARTLRERGLDVRVVDVSEMHKADGALTCLSLRVPAPGAYCT